MDAGGSGSSSLSPQRRAEDDDLFGILDDDTHQHEHTHTPTHTQAHTHTLTQPAAAEVNKKGDAEKAVPTLSLPVSGRRTEREGEKREDKEDKEDKGDKGDKEEREEKPSVMKFSPRFSARRASLQEKHHHTSTEHTTEHTEQREQREQREHTTEHTAEHTEHREESDSELPSHSELRAFSPSPVKTKAHREDSSNSDKNNTNNNNGDREADTHIQQPPPPLDLDMKKLALTEIKRKIESARSVEKEKAKEREMEREKENGKGSAEKEKEKERELLPSKAGGSNSSRKEGDNKDRKKAPPQRRSLPKISLESKENDKEKEGDSAKSKAREKARERESRLPRRKESQSSLPPIKGAPIEAPETKPNNKVSALSPYRQKKFMSAAEKRVNDKLAAAVEQEQGKGKLRLPKLRGAKPIVGEALMSKDDSHEEKDLDDNDEDMQRQQQIQRQGSLLDPPHSSPMTTNMIEPRKHKKPLYQRIIERARRKEFLEEQKKQEMYKKSKQSQPRRVPTRKELKEHMQKFDDMMKQHQEQQQKNHVENIRALRKARQLMAEKMDGIVSDIDITPSPSPKKLKLREKQQDGELLSPVSVPSNRKQPKSDRKEINRLDGDLEENKDTSVSPSPRKRKKKHKKKQKDHDGSDLEGESLFVPISSPQREKVPTPRETNKEELDLFTKTPPRITSPRPFSREHSPDDKTVGSTSASPLKKKASEKQESPRKASPRTSEKLIDSARSRADTVPVSPPHSSRKREIAKRFFGDEFGTKETTPTVVTSDWIVRLLD